jgi:protein-disulfide isomerase
MKRNIVFAMVMLGLGVSIISAIPTATAQQTNNPDDIKEILIQLKDVKASQASMQRDIQEIKVAVRGRQAAPPQVVPTNLVVNVEGHAFKGAPEAQLVMIEFTDYQCPFCRRYYSNTFSKIDTDYIQTGKLKYYVFNSPLPMHKDAPMAAQASVCARDQKKFWEMRDSLFSQEGAAALSREALDKKAKELGLNETVFQACLNGGQHTNEIDSDISIAQKLGMGTPSFLFGVVEPTGGKVRGKQIMAGARPYDDFKSMIDELLSAKPQKK